MNTNVNNTTGNTTSNGGEHKEGLDVSTIPGMGGGAALGTVIGTAIVPGIGTLAGAVIGGVAGAVFANVLPHHGDESDDSTSGSGPPTSGSDSTSGSGPSATA